MLHCFHTTTGRTKHPHFTIATCVINSASGFHAIRNNPRDSSKQRRSKWITGRCDLWILGDAKPYQPLGVSGTPRGRGCRCDQNMNRWVRAMEQRSNRIVQNIPDTINDSFALSLNWMSFNFRYSPPSLYSSASVPFSMIWPSLMTQMMWHAPSKSDMFLISRPVLLNSFRFF